MSGKEFVQELERENESFWNALPPDDRSWYKEGMTMMQLIQVHQIRCNNEMGAVQAGLFLLKTVPDLDLKILFAQQVEDEARHFRLLANRLKELGGDPTNYKPTPAWQAFFGDPAALFDHDPLQVAAGFQLTSEGLANAKHVSEAVNYTSALGDTKTEELYRKIIRPDETTHVAFGRMVVERMATTPEREQVARAACAKSREYMVRIVKEFREQVYA